MESLRVYLLSSLFVTLALFSVFQNSCSWNFYTSETAGKFLNVSHIRPGDEDDSPSLAFKRLQELEARDRRFRGKFLGVQDSLDGPNVSEMEMERLEWHPASLGFP